MQAVDQPHPRLLHEDAETEATILSGSDQKKGACCEAAREKQTSAMFLYYIRLGGGLIVLIDHGRRPHQSGAGADGGQLHGKGQPRGRHIAGRRIEP